MAAEASKGSVLWKESSCNPLLTMRAKLGMRHVMHATSTKTANLRWVGAGERVGRGVGEGGEVGEVGAAGEAARPAMRWGDRGG